MTTGTIRASIFVWKPMMLAVILCLAAAEDVAVPKAAHPVVVDGTIHSAEWSDAKKIDLGDGRSLHLKHDEKDVYVAFATTGEGVASLHVFSDSKVYILHASAALGTGIYAKEVDVWNVSQQFSFSCRDASNSAAAIEAREKFYKSDGWVANVSRQGTQGHREFRIDKKFFSGEQSKAVLTYIGFQSTEKISSFPKIVSDDSTSQRLVTGWLDEPLKFSPAGWIRFQLMP